MSVLLPMVGKDEDLFKLLRQSSLQCDDTAPIYVSKQQISRWRKERKDLQQCADSIEEQQILRKLEKRQVDELRKQHFQEAVARRAAGLSSSATQVAQQHPSRLPKSAKASLADMIATSFMETNDGLGVDAVSYMESLVAYQAKRHRPAEVPRCLLCGGQFSSKGSMNRHYQQCHASAFEEEAPCPECNDIIGSLEDWETHVQMRHGRTHAPTSATIRSGRNHQCLLCRQTFINLSSLSGHTTRKHAADFANPFPCPACCADINGQDEWCDHVAASHGIENAPKSPPSTKPTCLMCGDSTYNQPRHFLKRHAAAFEVPIPCPECTRQRADIVPIIAGPDDWQIHCAKVHGMTGLVISNKKQSRCLFCNKFFRDVAGHHSRNHERQERGLYPFPCPECVRTDKDPGPQIEGRGEWVSHCAAVHSDISAANSVVTEINQKRKRVVEEDTNVAGSHKRIRH